MKFLTPTPIENIRFNTIDCALKRDDLIHHAFSGNKARKFAYYLEHTFEGIHNVYSYGSSQSNAMYSLSVLAKYKKWYFTYYVDHISAYLKDNPHGNYLYALQNGMHIVEDTIPEIIPQDTLMIGEGGREKKAAYGIQKLADEILMQLNGEIYDIFLPSGTGTTALYLQKSLPLKVYTTPCVGDSIYLKKQFFSLETDPNVHPIILNTVKKYHFGKLYHDFFKIWIELKKQTDIVFDMLYDPKGWLCILENKTIFKNKILYIHQGGLIGNESMLKRYERKFSENIT